MADVNWNLALYDPIAKQKQGFDYATQVADQAALLRAGSQYAGGDYSGAANTVARSGDFATAGKLQDYATNRQAGALYAGGDYAGAGKALAQGGDIEGAGKLQDRRIKMIEAQQDTLGRSGAYLTAAIKQYPNLAQQAWGIAKQQLQAAEIPPARIAEFEQMFANDPAKAAALMGQLGDLKLTWQKAGDTTYGLDARGNIIQTLKDESGGAYPGKSPESTDVNYLIRGVKDPTFRNTPEYIAAWNRQNVPRTQIIEGNLVTIPPNVSTWAPAPGAYQGGTPTPAAPGSVPRASNVADTPSGVTPHNYTGTDADTTSGKAALAGGANAPTVSGTPAPAAVTAPPQSGPAPAPAPVPGAPGVTVTRLLPQSGTVRDLTPKELYDRGFGPGARGQINTQTGEISIKQQSTPDERKTAGYSKRVDEAAQNLARLEQQGIIKPTAQILLSEQNGVFRLVLSNPKDRQFVQASKEWLAPILRKDTGAAVTDKEFDEYSYIYIPRAEDTPEVLAQKAAARRVAEDVLYAEAGSSYADMFGARPARVKSNTQRGPYAPGKGPVDYSHLWNGGH